jgi:hypothetical protein
MAGMVARDTQVKESEMQTDVTEVISTVCQTDKIKIEDE